MQLTEQIHNDPTRMGAKSTTTSNHPSTPVQIAAPSAIQACSRQLSTIEADKKLTHYLEGHSLYFLLRYRRCYCNKEMAAKHDKTIPTQEYDLQKDLDLAEF